MGTTKMTRFEKTRFLMDLVDLVNLVDLGDLVDLAVDLIGGADSVC